MKISNEEIDSVKSGSSFKFQGYGLFHSEVLSNLLAWRWITHPRLWIELNMLIINKSKDTHYKDQ